MRTRRNKPWLAALAALLALVTVTARAAETITYIHWDALGSPVAATDEAGHVIWRESYRPYGARIDNEAGASANSRWYTGHPQDADTGLVYAGARYYDPVIGRFYGVDSVGVQEGQIRSFNRYAYGANNPYRYVDPDGHFVVDALFVGYDIYSIYQEGFTKTNLIATGLDIGSTLGLGFGLGELYRAGRAVDRGYDAARGAEEAAHASGELEKVPNQYGSRGGPAHTGTIDRRIRELRDQGYKHLNGGNLKEEVIRTPGGHKSSRRPDITMEASDGSIYRENIGRSTRTGSPISRERKALDDIEAVTGSRPGFTPYDR